LLQKSPEPNEATYYSRPRDRRIGGLDLEGELDFSEFSGLKKLLIFTQPNLTLVKGLEKCLNLLLLDIRECERLENIFTCFDQ
jgi:hypothetical protein